MGEKASWDEARIGNPLWRNVFCEERITPDPHTHNILHAKPFILVAVSYRLRRIVPIVQGETPCCVKYKFSSRKSKAY